MLTLVIQRTPSDIKWLLNERAALSGEALQLAERRQRLEARLATVEYRIFAIDRTVELINAWVSGNAAGTVRAWKGRYGSRGALREAVSALLIAAAPAPVSTWELSSAIQICFSLEFATRSERTKWKDNSLRACLRSLLADGKVERIHSASYSGSHESGQWRWRNGLPSLAELASLSEHACTEVK